MENSRPESGDPLARSVQLALTGPQRHLALTSGRAMRYNRDVAPFAAIRESTEQAMADLRSLLIPGESIYLLGERPPDTSGLRWDGVLPCLQMLWPMDLLDLPVPRADSLAQIEDLDYSCADEMLDLISVAFPGFFRPATCRMGRYYGIREDGRLVAMCGERMVLEHGGRTWSEISGLCTHPEHAGRGLGTALLLHILREHRKAGTVSWLHVSEANTKAIELYKRLGFIVLRRVELQRFVRESP